VIQKTDFLIVEDELLIAESISDILINAGCDKIRMVSSVEDAISEIETRKPQMILTDINLGREKTGIDLGSLLQTTYQIPFIYITSHTSPEILGKAKHTRPNAYIVKPFKTEDLIVAIELALFNSIDKFTTDIDLSELIVKEGRAMIRLDCNHITWLEADGNYTTINLKDHKRRVVRNSLAELTEQLSTSQFTRIHKSYVVNKKHVIEIKANSLIIDHQELPIGRSYRQEAENILK
jgi:DNA-binding LytR/AlgR family response regulator